MQCRTRGVGPLATALALSLIVAAASTPALADQSVQVTEPPVIVIQSSSGIVTVVRGDPGAVRVAGNNGATLTTFAVTRENQGSVVLPAGMGLPATRFKLPVKEGTIGVRVVSPGGDLTVYVPPRVGALLVKADTGDVAITGTRGPYVVVAEGGNVDLRRVVGFGHVRTTFGHVSLLNVGGNLHVNTTFGSVVGRAMFPERAEIKTQGGDIQWFIARLGGGPYRFTSGAGNVRVGLDETAAADIDAQSTQGMVVNRFSRAALVRFASRHAASVSLSGGGPQITAESGSGTVDIGPRKLY